MRDIKFRVWDKKEKRMYYPLIFHFEFIKTNDGKIRVSPNLHKDEIGVLSSPEPPLVVVREGERILKYPDEVVIMQYTGLKDKNGKEIYEGDIVRIKGKVCYEPFTPEESYYKVSNNYIVELSPYGVLFKNPNIKGIDKLSLAEYSFKDCDIEVIGNIYKHKHLLNQEGLKMREIKFRGLNALGEFVYGLPYGDKPYETGYYEKYPIRLCWVDENGGHCNQPIKDGTLQQYIGLKDVNDKEIYEGDIVKYTFKYGKDILKGVGVIEYGLGGFWISRPEGDICLPKTILDCDDFTLEVIGNIYDNPELLKESKQ